MHSAVRVLAAGLVVGVVAAGGAAFAKGPDVGSSSVKAAYAEQHQEWASVAASATPEAVAERVEERSTHSQGAALPDASVKEAMRAEHRIEAVHAPAVTHEPGVQHGDHPAQAGTDPAYHHDDDAGEQDHGGVAPHESSMTVHTGASAGHDQVHEGRTSSHDSTHHSGDHR